VLAWLEHRGLAPEPELIKDVLRVAKRNTRVLSDDEVFDLIEDWYDKQGRPWARPEHMHRHATEEE